MIRSHLLPLPLLALFTLAPIPLAASCAGTGPGDGDAPGDGDGDGDGPGDGDGDGDGDGVATWEDARPIIEAHCARCHSANRLSTYRRLETHQEVSALRESMLDKIQAGPMRGQRMPIVGNHTDTGGCEPAHVPLNERRLSDAEIATLSAYLERTDHREYVDPFPALSAPEVPLLTGAEQYDSSEFGVLNDGFLPDPNGNTREYMEAYGYDSRDFDQMEDDWFCIQFDPGVTDLSYLTGVQVLTESGQIFLGAQLVIDTTGGSDAAKAAADERGDDWYRCDPGLGFNGAVPLWRTVPGGGAIELPAGTGLPFEAGWRFVLRVDFHTHFDRDEFELLDQNGVIDIDEGTMTWFNRASLRARWAPAEDVDRELQWVSLGPSTPEEREAFLVVLGPSTLSYTAAIDAAPNTTYSVFSAEVSAGKSGKQLQIVDTSTDACIANNSDFGPKWIEGVIYGEDDAPALDAASTLELTCDFDNDTQDVALFGPESEATVWGRKERCSGTVFYYAQ